jgi:magnesium chelatase subunit I
LPYSEIVGQDQIKLALELAYVAPRLGGVLLSGQRGTAKSTAVRALSVMLYGALPVTLPINATEDRVVGGWKLDELLRSNPVEQPGLLEEAGEKGLLYVDEVNLLDDHIVNIILDVTSTGVLVVEREGRDEVKQIHFTLVGTMNPEEGGLRPQLLDRFGLMVDVKTDDARRGDVLTTMLAYDAALQRRRAGSADPWLTAARRRDRERKAHLVKARKTFSRVDVGPVAAQCIELARTFQAPGHRGEFALALAARACAALDGAEVVTSAHLARVAPLALQHRRLLTTQGEQAAWGAAEDEIARRVLDVA